MKITGIIVEYNPLHLGHIHHLKETRRLSGADVIIAVMSPHVVQRGEFSCADKFSRTRWALQAGIDLVVELPGVFTLQNADIFAHASIQILNHLGVDNIYFGSEAGDIQPLRMSAEIMRTDAYNELVRKYMAQGHSYPSSSDKAIGEITASSVHRNPNDILGIQYLEAIHDINPEIIPHTIPRIKTGYHAPFKKDETIQSATALRTRLKNNESIKGFVPDYVHETIDTIVTLDDFTELIRYNLIRHDSASLSGIFAFEEGLENHFLNHSEFTTIDDLLESLATRRYTFAKIKRALMHMLIDISKRDLYSFEVPYLRILGMNKTGQNYLNIIKKDLTLPLITKLKKEKHPYLDIELRITRLFDMAKGTDHHKEEFKPVLFL